MLIARIRHTSFLVLKSISTKLFLILLSKLKFIKNLERDLPLPYCNKTPADLMLSNLKRTLNPTIRNCLEGKETPNKATEMNSFARIAVIILCKNLN